MQPHQKRPVHAMGGAQDTAAGSALPTGAKWPKLVIWPLQMQTSSDGAGSGEARLEPAPLPPGPRPMVPTPLSGESGHFPSQRELRDICSAKPPPERGASAAEAKGASWPTEALKQHWAGPLEPVSKAKPIQDGTKRSSVEPLSPAPWWTRRHTDCTRLAGRVGSVVPAAVLLSETVTAPYLEVQERLGDVGDGQP